MPHRLRAVASTLLTLTLCASMACGSDDEGGDDGAANDGQTGPVNNGDVEAALDDEALDLLLAAIAPGPPDEAALEQAALAVEPTCDALADVYAPAAVALAAGSHATTLEVDCGVSSWLERVQNAIDDHDGQSWLVIALSGRCEVPASHPESNAIAIDGTGKIELRGGAVIDGRAWSGGRDDEAVLIGLYDAHDVVIRDLTLRGAHTATEGADAGGVYAEGVVGLVLEDLEITDIEVDYDEIADPAEGNAFGIKVIGAPGAGSRDVAIRYVRMTGLRTGQSENLTLAGDVSSFVVAGVSISDVDNIGIDLIGGEEYGGDVQARRGLICGNGLRDQLGQNPAYDGEDSYGAGIYLDGGGSDCLVALNVVQGFSRGFEIGAEQANPTVERARLFGNVSTGARGAGLLTGSLAERDDPGAPTDRETRVERHVIADNASSDVSSCVGGGAAADEGAATCEAGSVDAEVELCLTDALPSRVADCGWQRR